MLDPDADVGRRAWTTCPRCGVTDSAGCYLLGYDLGLLWCQCPGCHHRFWWDTGVGRGRDESLSA
jgi:hypothetical protein